MRALFIKNIGYCLPVFSCFFFKNLLIKTDKIIAIIKLHKTMEKPSLKIGDGEKRPLLLR